MAILENLEKNIGLIRPTDIINEMQGAYLDYAMSVIVSRALPDVRDGLKPVHRRILYAMSHDLGLDHTKAHKKSARIVGEVLGKYHPHGDTAVYDSMVRMAQDFSLRYPLVDGQGNFGSIDGDNAAAMRYTEARMSEITSHLLADLEKDTVDWHDNFDNSLREPDILPAALPNLLINGSSGIAVGMSTNVPPHNLREIVDALAFMIDNFGQLESITVEHLMQFVKGPDFPTGGIAYRYRTDGKNNESQDVIAQGYSVGRGRLIVQAKAHFEEMSRNRSRIVVTELPYQTNKTNLLERIAALVRDGKLEGITDLRDESDRAGMRIVLELTRNVEPKDVLADLFKHTPLQQTFGMQMLALVNGEPRTLSLKRMLQLFIEHRQEIVRRRSEFDLARARERAHIVEGLLKALDILDEVIATIRRSRSAETARNNLMRDFDFTQVQAQAILDMQLRRLAAMERTRLKDEYKELQERIAYLEKLLADPALVLALIKEDLLALREKYGDARRTQIVDRTRGTLTSTDLLPQQDVWVSIGANGSLRRQEAISLTASALRQIGKNSEVALLRANTRDYLYLFNSTGQCRRMSVHELPYNGTETHFSEATEYTRRDVVTAALALPRLSPSQSQGYLCMVTALGSVKRVTMADFLAAAAQDPVVINVDSKDRLIAVLHTQGEQEIVMVSSGGQSIRFSEEDVRAMGLAAGGVGGMKLKKGERIIYAAMVDPAGELLTITEAGFAKRTSLNDYSSQGRYGSGIVTHKPNKRTGGLAAALMIEQAQIQVDGNSDGRATDALVVLPSKGPVKVVDLAEIPQMGRGVQGKAVVEMSSGATVVAIKQVMQPPEVAVEAEEEPTPEVTLPEVAANGADGTNGSTSSNGSDSNTGAGTSAKAESKANANGDGAGKKTAANRSSRRTRTLPAEQSVSPNARAEKNGAEPSDSAKGKRASAKRKRSRGTPDSGSDRAPNTRTDTSAAQDAAPESKPKSTRKTSASNTSSSKSSGRTASRGTATSSKASSSRSSGSKSSGSRSGSGAQDDEASTARKPRTRRKSKTASAQSDQNDQTVAEAKQKPAARTRKRTASSGSSSRASRSASAAAKSDAPAQAAAKEEAAPKAKPKATPKAKSTSSAKPASRARSTGKLAKVTSVNKRQVKKSK